MGRIQAGAIPRQQKGHWRPLNHSFSDKRIQRHINPIERPRIVSASSQSVHSAPSSANSAETKSVDFIRTIINEHMRTDAYAGRVATRFPPEPNGYLHIGHAKSICLNFGIANDYSGACHLRMDDTDPTKESMEYVESIKQDVKWLGFDWGDNMFYASDYFEQLYDYAVKLIQLGKAYVCSLNEQEIREYRGTVTEPGKDSPYRNRSVEENLDLFRRMRAGEFPDGAHVVRAKIDMASPNMKMRDPLIYRIRHAHHYRTGDKWCIYPLYDFAHCLSDSIERITHSICTLEFENNRELYDWILDTLEVEKPRPHQYEFARLSLNYTVMSKRKLLYLVEKKLVSGWDDPRLPTISGMRRRGVTPEALRKFCESIGIAKANSSVDMAQLEFAIRDDLNQRVPRVLAVLRPLKVIIENYPEGRTEDLDAPLYPHDVPKEGSRLLPFSREIYIEQDDFMENPPKDYYRLSPGAEVRLRHAYVIRCDKVVKNDAGEVTELYCHYFPETKSGEGGEERKVKGTIHWVSAAHAVPAEIRLYDRLFVDEFPEDVDQSLNPNSLVVLKDGFVEASLASAEPGSRYQFERLGYFCADSVDSKPGSLVFNRIVTLRDSWAKKAAPEKAAPVKKESQPKEKKASSAPAPAKAPVMELTPAQEERFKRYQETMGLPADNARMIASDEALANFFETALSSHASPKSLSNWVVNELQRVLKDANIAALPFGPEAFASLVAMVDDEVISGKIAKDVFEEMLSTGADPKQIVDEKGLKQITDPSQLAPIVTKVLAANPDNVTLYKEGRNNVLGFLVGQVLKETGGKASPKLINELVVQQLNS